TASGRSKVERARLTYRAGDSRDAAAVKRANVSPAKACKKIGVWAITNCDHCIGHNRRPNQSNSNHRNNQKETVIFHLIRLRLRRAARHKFGHDMSSNMITGQISPSKLPRSISLGYMLRMGTPNDFPE